MLCCSTGPASQQGQGRAEGPGCLRGAQAMWQRNRWLPQVRCAALVAHQRRLVLLQVARRSGRAAPPCAALPPLQGGGASWRARRPPRCARLALQPARQRSQPLRAPHGALRCSLGAAEQPRRCIPLPPTPPPPSQADLLLAEGRLKYNAGDRMGALRLWEQALDRVGRAAQAVHPLADSWGWAFACWASAPAARLRQRRCPPQGPTQQQRVIALWNAACVHASFGDVELAQIPLKEAIFGGLDFPAALAGTGDPTLVKLQASAQAGSCTAHTAPPARSWPAGRWQGLRAGWRHERRLRRQERDARAIFYLPGPCRLPSSCASSTPSCSGRARAPPPHRPWPPAVAAGVRAAAAAAQTRCAATSHRQVARRGAAACWHGCRPSLTPRALRWCRPQELQTETQIDASVIGIAVRVVALLLALSGLGVGLFYLGLKYAFPEAA